MRYVGTANTALQIKCEVFQGTRLLRSKPVISVPQAVFASSFHVLSDQHVIAYFDKKAIFSLAPFIHFSIDAYGHQTNLSFYKKKASGNYVYEVVGKSVQITEPQSSFAAITLDFDNLLQKA